MNVTINTDASYIHRESLGAYAFWIVSDRGRLVQGGVLKGAISNSTEAEVKSIGNAFAALLKLEWKDVKYIQVNTDCKPAMQFIQAGGKGRKDPLGESAHKTSKLIDQVCKKFHLSRKDVKFKHVRAHTHVRSSRNYVNDWCDSEAKKWVYNAVKNIPE
jgi:ribonuclease HI